MKLKVFSVYDIKAEAYMPPFMMHTLGQAERAFQDLVNDSESSIYKHPEDYRLFMISEFDDSTAKYEHFDHPQHVCDAINLINKK